MNPAPLQAIVDKVRTCAERGLRPGEHGLHDPGVQVADGQVVHHGACQAPETHAALEAVFDHRIRICQVEDLWMALPR